MAKVNKEALKSGNVLIFMKERVLKDPKYEHVIQFLDCLSDSELQVPMTLELSEEDEELFKNAEKGEEVKLKNDVKMHPDWLKHGDKLYFPIFSNLDQPTEEYKSHFSWINLNIISILKFVEDNKECQGIVLDAYSKPLIIQEEVLDALKEVINIKNKEEK